MCLQTHSIKVLETVKHSSGGVAGPEIRVVLIDTQRLVQCQHDNSNSAVSLLVSATHLAHCLALLLECRQRYFERNVVELGRLKKIDHRALTFSWTIDFNPKINSK